MPPLSIQKVYDQVAAILIRNTYHVSCIEHHSRWFRKQFQSNWMDSICSNFPKQKNCIHHQSTTPKNGASSHRLGYSIEKRHYSRCMRISHCESSSLYRSAIIRIIRIIFSFFLCQSNSSTIFFDGQHGRHGQHGWPPASNVRETNF